MNGISKGKKHTVNIAQAFSFKNFASAEKARLKTAYPFLSPGQINGKVKEKWKLLDHKETQSGSKAALKVTPSKAKKIKSFKKSPRRQKQISIDVCGTPEHINLYRLNDFRKHHTETYENDFDADDTRTYTASLSKQSITKAGKGKTLDGVSNGKNNVVDEEMNTGDMESLESDVENDGILIRRTDLYECSDVTDKGILAEQSDNTNGSEDGLGNSDIKAANVLNSSCKDNKNVKENTNKSNNEENACYGGNSMNENLFKSPNPKGSADKRCSGRKTRRSAPASLATPNTSSSVQAALTPQVSNSNEETEKYTTPQMDDVLQKLTIHEVNKAPQKRRHSYQSMQTVKKVKAAVSGRHVTRSLLSLHSDLNKDVVEKLGEESDVSGKGIGTKSNTKDVKNKVKTKAKLSLRNKKRLNIKDENNNNSEEFDETETHIEDSIVETDLKSKERDKVIKLKSGKSFEMTNNKEEFEENNIKMNPSGDASQIDQEDMDVNFNIQTEVIDNNKGDSKTNLKRKLKVAKTDQTAKRKKGQKTTLTQKKGNLKPDNRYDFSTNSSSSRSSGSQSSVDFASSPESSLRSLTPLRKSYRNTEPSNPALERVLQSLRSTRVTSPTWSCSNSSVSSPRLLSPALSGVSELSSLSDQCSNEQKRREAFDVCFDNMKAGEDKDLCDLFNDVTPPENKTKGLYKTARMVTSGRQNEKSELFQDQKDDVFF